MSDRNAILEALTAKMEEIWNDDLSFEDQAAAVLELVGPRELVWVWDVNMCAYSVVHSGKYYVQWDDEAGAWYASLELGDDENPIIIDPGDLPDISSAQSAAQAHADAAHWANTKIGGE